MAPGDSRSGADFALAGLRVALVGPTPPPHGGMANQTRLLGRLLEMEGAHVERIATNPPFRPAWIANARGLRALARLLPYITRLWGVAGRSDVIHVMASSGWSWHLYAAPVVWMAAARGTPVVVNYRGGGARSFFDREFWAVGPTLRRAGAIAVPSAFLERIFQERGIKAWIVPNMIDRALFRPAAPAPPGGPPAAKEGGGPELVVARNLETIYDVGTALRALKQVRVRVPGAHLSVAGSGPERSRLEALAMELGLQGAVTFTGQLENADMVALYQRADVAINPSRVDNMPISILEALACGVPVVSTNVGGIPDLVAHDRTALLVPPQDPEAMASAVVSILVQPARAEALRQAGLSHVAGYSWPHVRGRWLEVYRHAAAAAGASDRPRTPAS